MKLYALTINFNDGLRPQTIFRVGNSPEEALENLAEYERSYGKSVDVFELADSSTRYVHTRSWVAVE